jgi:hypothetical protein
MALAELYGNLTQWYHGPVWAEVLDVIKRLAGLPPTLPESSAFHRGRKFCVHGSYAISKCESGQSLPHP